MKHYVLVSTQISKWLANTKMSQTNMQKVLTKALIHEFKPFVISNTYLISTSQIRHHQKLLNQVTLRVTISSNSKNVTISSANKQKVLTEPLTHEFKPFVFSNTYLISTSQANPAKFDKMMATK